MRRFINKSNLGAPMQRLNPLPLILFFAFTLFAFAEKNGTSVTLLYSGEEQGQLGAHGCGTEQIGGLAHRQTLLSDLNTKYNAALNLHTGNLIDGADPNAEWVYQIGLSALTTVLSDVEMGSKNGGYGDWRSELTRSGSGSFANCSQSPCPTGTYSRTFGHYRCAPCEGTESTYTRTYTTKVEKSWCVSFTEPDGCQYRHYTTEYQWSCVAYTGTCGSDS